MILDNLLLFTGTSNGAAAGITISAHGDRPTTGTQTSSNIIDLGINSGIPSSANGGGARDIGIGDDPAMKLMILVTTAFGGGTSLQINLQGAVDNGSGAPAAFSTWWGTPVYAEASLVAGARLFDTDMPRPPMGVAIPRFLQLQYVSVGTHNAGVLESYIVLDRDDQLYQGTSNAIYGGYPAGITVAN